MDKNVLVQRGALDVVSILFPFHQSFLLPDDLTSVLTAALHTLLKRDISLSRRLYSWLLGTQVDKGSLITMQVPPGDTLAGSEATGSNNGSQATGALDVSYFEKYSKNHLALSLGCIMTQARRAVKLSLTKLECVLPYRMLRALQERPEIGERIASSVMLDLVKCLKDQIEGLGGVAMLSSSSSSQHQGKDASVKAKGGFVKDARKSGGGGGGGGSGKKGSLKGDIIQSANLFFSSLRRDAMWGWMEDMLAKCVSEMQVGGSGKRRKGGSVAESPVGGGDVAMLSVGKGSSVGVGGGGGGEDDTLSKDKSSTLKSILALFIFLMQIMPKV